MRIARLIALCLVLLLGTSCARAPQSAAPTEPVRGGELTVAIVPGLTHINAQATNTRYIFEATQYIYETLFDRDEKGKVIPWLVREYEVSPDGLLWTLKLQPGVKFHDGSPFNAEVVKWNLERKISKKLDLAELISDITQIEVVDDLTLKLHLSKPNLALPANLAAHAFAMYSPVAVEKLGEEGLKTNAVGTGPYILEEFKPNDVVKLKRNADYWRKGLPYLDRITLRVVPDVATRAMMLEAGDVDVAVNLSDTDVNTTALSH